jgi:hypothetical protein
MKPTKSAKEKDFDLWALEWKNAYNFFNTKGHIHTKSKLKDKWYKEFGIMINQRINLAIDLAIHDCEEKIQQAKLKDSEVCLQNISLIKENTELKAKLSELEGYQALRQGKIKARDK